MIKVYIYIAMDMLCIALFIFVCVYTRAHTNIYKQQFTRTHFIIILYRLIPEDINIPQKSSRKSTSFKQ